MIEKIVYLWCDRCHAIGPSGETIKSVRRAARKLGWRIGKPTDRHPHSTPATCPTCVVAYALVVAP